MDEITYRRHWEDYKNRKAEAEDLLETLIGLYPEKKDNLPLMFFTAKRENVIGEEEYQILKEFYQPLDILIKMWYPLYMPRKSLDRP